MISQRQAQQLELDNYVKTVEYGRYYWTEYDMSILRRVMQIRRPGRVNDRSSFNDVVIMADTETSKAHKNKCAAGNDGVMNYDVVRNYIVIWTLTISISYEPIVTLYGRRPSELIDCIRKIHGCMSGDKTVVYIHNLGYDYMFLRKFMFEKWGHPSKELSVKPYYPISIEFDNGILLRDSLILAQRSLGKWAEDLNVKHKKAIGEWDYDKIRTQSTEVSEHEMKYSEYDTLTGVECINATLKRLGKNISNIPLTATGIPREQVRKRGASHNAHDVFLRQALDYEQYIKMLMVYHGGYVHGNRFFVNTKIDDKDVECYDFASSYPFTLCAYKFPCEKFTKVKNNVDCKFILDRMEDFAFYFKLILIRPECKLDVVMPALQMSKCTTLINPVLDNGRVLKADYAEIWLTEYDLEIIAEQYSLNNDNSYIRECEYAKKDYLPRWFTDYVFECFINKTMLKGGDPVAYALAKTIINALYGMCVQQSIKENIVEDYEHGGYSTIRFAPCTDIEDADDYAGSAQEAYDKYLNNKRTILPYQWGVWVTAIAFNNLFKLGKCAGLWLYSDTDSCYGQNWDVDAVNRYNESCKERLRANGYGPVVRNGREYWLGIAEHEGDKDTYTEYKYMGAKRYCGRQKADGKLHITVAGVPKKGVNCLYDNIDNFARFARFSGAYTGKKTHHHVYVDKIYIDYAGNECGDYIDLVPCDYVLDCVDVVDWDYINTETITIEGGMIDRCLI